MDEKKPKIYKHPEAPTVCEECDGTCFVTAGGYDLVCYHCHLVSENTALAQQVEELKKEINNWQGSQKALCAEIDVHKAAWTEAVNNFGTMRIRAEAAESKLAEMREALKESGELFGSINLGLSNTTTWAERIAPLLKPEAERALSEQKGGAS